MRQPQEEQWRPCPDYEGLYEVSDQGRVRSLYFQPARVCAIIKDFHGYSVAMLSKDRKRTPKTIHRLVCRAFHGEPSALRPEAAHLDGDRSNASAANLMWTTRRENLAHMRAHGTAPVGERNPHAKLTEKTARDILQRLGAGECRTDLAAEFGVSNCAVRDIRSGKRWGHLARSASPESLPNPLDLETRG